MKQPPNPIAEGLRASRRDPATLLLEILWRWSFWVVALLLFFITFGLVLRQLEIHDVFRQAVHSQNFRWMGMIGLSVLIKPAAKLLIALVEFVALAVGLGVLWSVLAAVVPRIVIRRLSGAAPLKFGGMLVVQWMRTLVALVCVLLLLATVATGIHLAIKQGHADLFRFYLICAPAIPLIFLLWLWLNWRLSMAAIFGREGQGLWAALRQARHTVRRHRSDFAGTAFVFLLLRTVGLLFVVAVIGLTSSMLGTAPQTYAALVMSLALMYFVFSDYLYVARLASYLALGAAPDPIAAEMGIVDPELPVEESSSR
jgi:hypothetical protein